MKATERDITNALHDKHRRNGDIFASQTKMGPAGSKIIDAVAIPRTWSPITVIGYEIKISRNDFLNDQKYPHYMTTCNLFSFVTPKGIIKKDEIPEDVGLVEYNSETNKLRTVKKAPYRNIQIMPELLLHIMFWKMYEYERPKSKQEYLDDIKAMVESKGYGHELAIKISDLKRKVWSLENETGERNWGIFQDLFEEKMGRSITNPFDLIEMVPVNAYDIQKYEEAAKYMKRAYKSLPQESDNK